MLENNPKFQLEQSEVRVQDIQHVRLNGKDTTLFKVYVAHYAKQDDADIQSFVFSGQYSLSGIIKRESTIKKRICLL